MLGPVTETPPTILTVGHSTHPIDRFIELLRSAGTEAIADVRRYPGSRRNPQFGAEPLRDALARAGIAYESFAQGLGGRRSARDAAHPRPDAPDNSAWRSASFRAYADYMAEPEFDTALERLQAVGRERLTAIMCAEAHPSRCHRQLIADALTVRGWEVIHLLANGRTETHRLSDHAVADGTRLSYPGSAASLPGV